MNETTDDRGQATDMSVFDRPAAVPDQVPRLSRLPYGPIHLDTELNQSPSWR
jgi:hypothetical protein